MSFMNRANIFEQLTGCRIPVVRLLWEQVDPVRFWAPRQSESPAVWETISKVAQCIWR